MESGELSAAAIAATVTTAVAKDAYNDALHPAVDECGKALALLPRTINAVLAPLEKWLLHREHSIEETKLLLAKKLENVPISEIVPPEPYVAVPALQAISYSMDCPELRELFANLLANASIKEKQSSVHPSFVEIIKQLHPSEAQLFSYINQLPHLPIMNIIKGNPLGADNTFEYLYKHFAVAPKKMKYDTRKIMDGVSVVAEFNDFKVVNPINIVNLHRLGLLEISYNQHASAPENYAMLEKHEFLQEFLNQVPTKYKCITTEMGTADLTPFGHQFAQICITSPT